jgi:hypothetical protein
LLWLLAVDRQRAFNLERLPTAGGGMSAVHGPPGACTLPCRKP